MKNPTIYLIAFAASLFLFSCKSAPDNAKVIPEDAQMVTTIHWGKMLEKADMEKVKELDNLMEKMRDNLDEDLQDLFDQLMEDPSESGIDFSVPMFISNYSKGKRFDDGYQRVTIMSFGMGDSEKFQELLDQLIDDPEFEEEEDYTWLYTSSDHEYAEMIAFTDDYGVYVDINGYRISGDDKERELERIMTLEGESTLLEYSENFAEFAKNDADIAYWISTEQMVDEADRDLDQIEAMMEELNTEFPLDRADLENNYITGEVNFEVGEVRLTSKITLSDALKDIYDEVEGDNLNTDHIGLVPGEEVFGVYAISMNMEGVKNKLEEWEFNDLIDEASSATFNLDYEETMTMFSGSVFFGMAGEVEQKSKSYSGESRTETWPGIYLGFGIGDDESLTKVIDELEGMEVPGMKIEQMDDIYELEFDRKIFYMAKTDELLVVSNDEEWTESVASDEIEQGLSDDVLDHFDGVPAAAYVSLDTEDWPESFSKDLFRGLGFWFGRGNEDKVESIMDLFDHIHMNGDMSEAETVLKLTDEENNSIFAILQLIDENLD